MLHIPQEIWLVIVPPTISALAALAVGLLTRRGVRELHVLVNSRLTELLISTAKASKAEGILEGTTTAAAVATENKIRENGLNSI